MVKGITLVGLAGLLGISAIPLLADGAADGSCWLRDAASPTKLVVYTVCEQGAVWSTADGGTTWTKNETGATERLRAMAFLDVNRGFVIGDHGLLLATTDGGKKWRAQPLETKEHLMDITFAGESGWISGFQGVLLHSADGGKTWAKQSTGTTQTLETVFFLDQDRGWAVGWAGTILLTTDGGKAWKSVVSDAASWSLTSVQFRDPQNGWMVGFAGQILRTRDGGLTWKTQESPVKGWLTAILFDSSNRGWISYDDGFLVSEDGGGSWKAVPIEGQYFLGKLLKVDRSLWAIGQSVVLKQGDGLKWSKIDSLVPNRSLGLDATPSTASTGH
jgi:photosystem II stability/assembly factor-like uncharacterized protein